MIITKYGSLYDLVINFKSRLQDFPTLVTTVARTPHSQHRRPRFTPWLEN